MYRILVPNAETRKAFDIISILTRKFPGIPLILGDVIGNSSSRRHLNSLFKGLVETLRVDSEENFIDDLLIIYDKYIDDKIIFIPEEEQTILYFYHFINQNGKCNFLYVLPEEWVYKTFRDKKSLNEYCIYHGFSAPVYYEVEDIEFLKPEQFPILLKPCIGSGSEGLFRLYKKEDLTDVIRKEVSKDVYLIQELIDNGRDVKGAFFLYNEGKCVDCYTHERLRTSPSTGGVTVLSKLSSNMNVLGEGKRILDSIGWNGLIMLEFLYDKKTDKYKVIEANARTWGSIMLSEFSGKNLLSNYVRICMGQDVVFNYRDRDAYIRWLFPVDILNYMKKLGRIPGFWNFNNTCFINWSYAGFWSAILFNLLNFFSVNNIKRFFRK